MTQERVTPTWEPTGAERAVLSGFRLVRDTYQGADEQMVSIRGAEAEYLLRKVGPMIAARSLREAVDEIEASAAENAEAKGTITYWAGYVEAEQKIAERLRARAAVLAPPQERP